MSLKIDDSYFNKFFGADADCARELESVKSDAMDAFDTVFNGSGVGSDYLGWRDLPRTYDKDEFSRILNAAEKIRNSCDIFVVLGIGGSYLGARAAIEFLYGREFNDFSGTNPKIYFAGNSISSDYLNSVIELCADKDICVNVISKSGKTTEPAIAFRVFRKLMEEKYGEDGARERIFVTTDKDKGGLHDLAIEKGYEMFVVPNDIGGRYSIFSAVGLLPIAVSGADISGMMLGAEAAMNNLCVKSEDNAALKYACLRNYCYRSGMKTEILSAYEPSLTMFAEWWKQLFGESEGKDGKGIYPSSCIFSTDLHSLGQYIQQGERTLFETVIKVNNSNSDVTVPLFDGDADGLEYIQGKSISEINDVAFKATVIAHTEGGVPNIIVEIDKRDEYNFGYLIYFFELACAVSGYTLDVNPFNQPGVEDYKNNMYALLGKQGQQFDEIREKISSFTK